VESLSTPNLSYLPNVFEMFVSDHVGEFCVAEMDNQIVACGKFSVMPDGSAWVETLRVIPAFQGLGVGKRIYERFFEVAKSRQITTLRMYTGVRNAVSKGLAERYGFKLAATYRGAWKRCGPESIRESILPFQQITDIGQAVDLLMPLAQKWHGHFVMNRTFYAITPALCRDWTQKGLVYTEPSTGSVLIAGARFMPEQALHISVLQGDIQACLNFAMQKGIEVDAEKLSCLFPPSAKDIQESLLGYGFELEKSDFIVMANESGWYDRKD
jgi:GNAT superfamily N-acetyltransferase